MKKRICYICLLVGFLLIGCTFLSHRVEETMMTQAVAKKLVGFDIVLPGSVMFEGSGKPTLYAAEEGLGWNTGIRATEVSDRSYEIMENGMLKLSGGSGTIIYTASREPLVGQRVNILDERASAPDRYLVLYLNGVPAKHDLPKDASPVKRSDSAILLEIPESALPFMEHEAKGKFGSIRGLQWRIYSLTDLEQLVGSLPLIALAAVLAAIPPVLFLLGVLLPHRQTGKDLMLRFHIGYGAASLAGFVGLLYAIRLPCSLVPADNIFQWEHYTAELSAVLSALEQLEELQLASLLNRVQTQSGWILAAGAAALAVSLVISGRSEERRVGKSVQSRV